MTDCLRYVTFSENRVAIVTKFLFSVGVVVSTR